MMLIRFLCIRMFFVGSLMELVFFSIEIQSREFARDKQDGFTILKRERRHHIDDIILHVIVGVVLKYDGV